jgi:hypothetical protein
MNMDHRCLSANNENVTSLQAADIRIPAIVTPVHQLKLFSQEDRYRTVQVSEEANLESVATYSPMQMMEHLATIAKERVLMIGAAEDRNPNDTSNTFQTIDALRFLASKEPPPSTVSHPTHLCPKLPTSAGTTPALHGPIGTLMPRDGRNYSSGILKRVREEEEYCDPCESPGEDVTSVAVKSSAIPPPSSTSLSYIIQLDNTHSATNAVHEIQSLVHQLEQCTNAYCYFSLYRRFSENLYHTVKSIHSQMITASNNVNQNQSQNNSEELRDHPSIMIHKRLLLDQLYKEAIEHVRILLTDATSMQAKEMSTAHQVSSNNPNIAEPNSQSHDTFIEKQDVGYTSKSNHDNSSHEYSKKKLAEYMTNWLRENWINPYPDEAGLSEMARECGASKTVVNNWLINSRTRKWRPAIAKACALGRPTFLLKEDSIHIFDGKPVQELKPVRITNSFPMMSTSKGISGMNRKGSKSTR